MHIMHLHTDFYNWNRVKIRYCDGASFAGEGFDKARTTHATFLSVAVVVTISVYRSIVSYDLVKRSID